MKKIISQKDEVVEIRNDTIIYVDNDILETGLESLTL